jgi:hypothetical protein
MLYVDRPGILPTTIKNRLSHDLAGLRSIFCFHRTGIQPHNVVLPGGNEERFTIGDTNAGSCASLLNMFGIERSGSNSSGEKDLDAILLEHLLKLRI